MASLIEREAWRLFYGMVDKTVDQAAPGGVATADAMQWTSDAFDYYVATHGRPKTANEARRMFEFAAILDLAMDVVRGRA